MLVPEDYKWIRPGQAFYLIKSEKDYRKKHEVITSPEFKDGKWVFYGLTDFHLKREWDCERVEEAPISLFGSKLSTSSFLELYDHQVEVLTDFYRSEYKRWRDYKNLSGGADILKSIIRFLTLSSKKLTVMDILFNYHYGLSIYERPVEEELGEYGDYICQEFIFEDTKFYVYYKPEEMRHNKDLVLISEEPKFLLKTLKFMAKHPSTLYFTGHAVKPLPSGGGYKAYPAKLGQKTIQSPLFYAVFFSVMCGIIPLC